MRTRHLWPFSLPILLALLVVGCSPGGVDEEPFAPQSIHGVWVTSNPVYADRSFEIQTQDLIFDTAEEGIIVYPIISVRREDGPDGANFEIDHRGTEGGTFTFTFSFVFDSIAGTIVFRNQPEMTWTRQPPGN